MSIQTLQDLYIDQLQDLYSANRQSLKVTEKLAEKAHNPKLQDALKRGVSGIEDGINAVEGLIRKHKADPRGEFCQGMEGLVKEARKHALEADIEDPDVRDVLIVAQYQCMCHYGIAGFGTAKAFAEALGNKDHASKLDTITSEIYDADENMTDLAERSINLEAKQG